MKMKLGTDYSPFLICASLTRSLCLSFRSEVCDTRHRYERSINFLTRCSVTRPEGSDTLTQSATSTTLTGTATASRLSSTTIRLKEGGRMMTFLAFKITTTDTQANSPQVTVVRRVRGERPRQQILLTNLTFFAKTSVNLGSYQNYSLPKTGRVL